ncbi:MAG: sigma-70 family RNA polymerase sigma factor [Spirochaetia bacterium]|nr:sigma-70 family RNA polymerase sigma factor [Spirochaetia bacterium]
MGFNGQENIHSKEDPVKKWEEVYRNENQLLYGYLLKKTNEEQAGDILQDSFLKLLQVMQKGRAIENPRAYVFQIARNLLILEYKKKGGRGFEVELPSGIEDNRFDPAEGVIKKDFLNILESARGGLSAREQEIFELRWHYGLKQKEIADVLARSERQIRRDIEKIVRQLRSVFESAGWKENELDIL